MIVTPQIWELTATPQDNKCDLCLTHFSSKGALELHLVKRHGVQSGFLEKKSRETVVKYHCPVDGCKYQAKEGETRRSFRKFKLLKQHYLKCHAAKDFSCEKCGKSYPTATFLERHVKKECGTSFVCVKCSLVYKTREALLTHCRRKRHFSEQLKKVVPGTTKAKSILFPKPTVTVTALPVQSTLESQASLGSTVETSAATALSELSWKVVVKRRVDQSTQTIRGCLSSERPLTKPRVRAAGTIGRKPRRARKDILTQTAANVVSTSGTQTTVKPLFEPSLPQNQPTSHQEHHTSAFTEDDFPQFFSSATQTNTEIDFDLHMFTDIDQYVNNETQTELINQQEPTPQQTWSSLDEDDCPALLDSHTQTVDLDEYSHNCTQTCNYILLNDFVELTDIETQTAWASLGIDSSLTTAETQTLL